jgi:hypothetical protein
MTTRPATSWAASCGFDRTCDPFRTTGESLAAFDRTATRRAAPTSSPNSSTIPTSASGSPSGRVDQAGAVRVWSSGFWIVRKLITSSFQPSRRWNRYIEHPGNDQRDQPSGQGEAPVYAQGDGASAPRPVGSFPYTDDQ